MSVTFSRHLRCYYSFFILIRIDVAWFSLVGKIKSSRKADPYSAS